MGQLKLIHIGIDNTLPVRTAIKALHISRAAEHINKTLLVVLHYMAQNNKEPQVHTVDQFLWDSRKRIVTHRQ